MKKEYKNPNSFLGADVWAVEVPCAGVKTINSAKLHGNETD
jgi:hypothetical protein